MEGSYILPKEVEVKVLKEKSGPFFAEIPKLGVFTEADTLIELEVSINNLIFLVYDIPERIQKEVRYVPERPVAELRLSASSKSIFRKLVDPDVVRAAC